MEHWSLLRLTSRAIFPGWFGRGLLLLALPAAAGAAPLMLTSAQTHWLAEHPVIRLASDPQWPPFSFPDSDGCACGLDVDMLHLVEKQLGRTFGCVAVGSWSEALRRGQAREIDVLTGTARTARREVDFIFTTAYIQQSMGIITRTGEPFMASMGSLAGRRIATVADYAITDSLRRDHPAFQLVLAPSMEAALRLVSGGDADAVITDLVNANYLIKSRGLMNLKIAGIADYKFELHYAVRRDWPELVGILDAALASIEPVDKQRIIDSWVKVDYADVVRWDMVWRVLMWVTAAALAIVSVVFWHNHRLRRELMERRRVERELRLAHDRLEHLNEEKTKIINMAAHDLRNPLTGVMLSLDLMDPENPAECRGVARDIKASARHMVQLISDLLDVQMLEAGHRRLREENTDLAAILRAVLDEYRPAAHQKRIALNARVAVDLPMVHIDAGAVRQVWDNLVSNALKYSPAGSEVAVTLNLLGGVVRLEVRDSGPGITRAEMPLLFTKYKRLSARPTGGESSIGLGLSIVKQLTEALGGRVWCESDFGRGATFIVELPAVAAEIVLPLPVSA